MYLKLLTVSQLYRYIECFYRPSKMKLIVSFLCIYACTCIFFSNVEGTELRNITHVPWIAYVHVKYLYASRTTSGADVRGISTKTCVGTIVDEWHVVTAAHCLCPRDMLKIEFETYNRKYHVKLYSIHRLFLKNACFGKIKRKGGRDRALHDIATLKSTRKIVFEQRVQPIAIRYEGIYGLQALKLNVKSNKRIRYFLTYPRKIWTEGKISTPRDIGGYLGGSPLLYCRNIIGNCYLIGIKIQNKGHSKDMYISTQAEQGYIRHVALQDLGYKTVGVSSSAVRKGIVSNMLFLSCILTMFFL